MATRARAFALALPAPLAEPGPGVRLAEAAAMSLLIGLCAQLRVELPFTPVPITGQSFAVLLAGALLGPRRGALAAALYLAEGCSGLPFFAGGGSGLLHLLGPRGGYLLGFVPAALLVGALAERGWTATRARTAALMALGSAVIFACGLAWLRRFVPPGRLLAMGLYPFLPGDLFKIALACAVLPRARLLLAPRE